MLLSAFLRRSKKRTLQFFFVERIRFLQGELYAESEDCSTVTLIGVHPESVDRMTESVVPSLM